jgi:hypothetical protein
VWDGTRYVFLPGRMGVAFDSHSRTWLRMPGSRRAGYREGEVSVWAGDRLLVWSGNQGGEVVDIGRDGVAFVRDQAAAP